MMRGKKRVDRIDNHSQSTSTASIARSFSFVTLLAAARQRD
jgi:hypothetical protein